MQSEFDPPFLLRNNHVQTLFPTLFRRIDNHPFYKERFVLSDGDFLEPFWYEKPKDGEKIAVLFHGLGGSYRSPYILGLMQKLRQNGINSVVMHYRGSSGVENDTPLSYHSGKTDDAKEFLTSVSKRFSKSEFYGVGFSLGANMLLKLLGQERTNAPFKAAVSVSSPMQLNLSAKRLQKGFSKLYQYHLLQELKKMLHRKFERFDMGLFTDLKKEQIDSLRTFYEFDAAYTAPVHGFRSVEEYYQKASSRAFCKHITVPTLLIHAKDDPFIPFDAFPTPSELSNTIQTDIQNYGGHVGFVEGSVSHPSYYVEKKVVEFLKTFKDKL